MDLCIKTLFGYTDSTEGGFVSILVLMDLCIKTSISISDISSISCFNPCFIGSMYKNDIHDR